MIRVEKKCLEISVKAEYQNKEAQSRDFAFNTIPFDSTMILTPLHLSFDGWLNGLAVIELTVCQGMEVMKGTIGSYHFPLFNYSK